MGSVGDTDPPWPTGTLQDLLDTFATFDDPSERAQVLISFADAFKPVPPEVATRPRKGPSRARLRVRSLRVGEAAAGREDGPAFAVENPSGISAKALATMLTKTLSGLTPAEIATVSPEIVERLFRQNISMGKGMGLRRWSAPCARWRCAPRVSSRSRSTRSPARVAGARDARVHAPS